MSNRTLRAMYAGMVRGRAKVQGSGLLDRSSRAAFADIACFVAPLAGITAADFVFDCREHGVVEQLRGKAYLLPFASGVGRVYAAVGALMTLSSRSGRVAMVFVEHHEVGGPGWTAALRAAGPFPVVVVVLPRWKGRARTDISSHAREAEIPGIAVDGGDAIALYRVAQESLVRARTGGGAALIEGVWFHAEGETTQAIGDPVAGLASYLRRRGIVSERWLQGLVPLG